MSDYEESDYEDEYDEEGPQQKKIKSNPFIDDTAQEDDQEEEEEVGDEEDENFVEDKGEDISGYQQRYSTMDHLQDTSLTNRGNRGNIIANIEKKYAGNEDYEDIDEEADVYQSAYSENAERAHTKQQNLPTPKDPKLFYLKCKQGKEKEAVITLLQKHFNLKNAPKKKDKVQITSAVYIDGYKGKIYIEAFRESHVRHAIQGLGHLIYENTLKLVPIKEMPDVLNVNQLSTKLKDLKVGDWVRVKRGTYKGDVGKVFFLDEARGLCHVTLVPRIDYSGGQSQETSKKVPQKLFDPSLLPPQEQDKIEHHKDNATGLSFTIYQNNKYRDGYLYKQIHLKSLDTKNVEPTTDEIQIYYQMENTNTAISMTRKTYFKKGDNVKVVKGDLKGMHGTVIDIDDESQVVTFLPKHQNFNTPLQFPSNQLQKHFEVGQFCKVIGQGSKWEGETGYIVRVGEDDDTVVLYNEVKKCEMTTFTSEIQETSASVGSEVKMGNYALFDMIRIDPQTMGVIVKFDANKNTNDALVQVVDNNDAVRTFKLPELGRKQNTKAGYKAPDKNKQLVGISDTIKVVDSRSPHYGREGVVKQVFRKFLFCYSIDLIQNSGMFAVPSGHCELRGAKNRQILNAQTSGAAGNTTNKRGFVFQKRRRHHPYTNRTIVITKGPYKGYLGIVKDASDSSARIELHSQNKVINVNINWLKFVDNDNKRDRNSQPINVATPYVSSGAATPFTSSGGLGNAPGTPWDSSKTPLHTGLGHETPIRPETPHREFNAWNTRKPNTPINDWQDNNPIPTPHDYSINTPGISTFTTPAPITPGMGDGYTNYAPMTPGNTNPITPGLNNPRTPGGNLGMMHPMTPGETYTTPGLINPMTPGNSYTTPVTSGMNMVTTPGLNPMTPGISNPVTPGLNPMTPGMEGNVYTPYQPVTPGVMDPYHPYHNPITPMGNPMTPGMNAPMTPGSNPITPGMNNHHDYE
ncbi:hypothetical protein ABK040_001106 [Willaertia magna]